jgi:hypothetical protein
MHQVVDVLDPGPARIPARIPGQKLRIKSDIRRKSRKRGQIYLSPLLKG